MNLNERVTKINDLESKQVELKKDFYDADKNKKSEDKKRIDKDIRKIDKDISKINDSYEQERKNRDIEKRILDDAGSFLNRGNDIKSNIKELESRLIDENVSSEEKNEIQSKINESNSEMEELKQQLCKKAIGETNFSWNENGMYPTEEIKKEKQKLEKLEKEKIELEENRKKQKELSEINKKRMNEQFDMAIEKYKRLLAAQKITHELFESRMQNMQEAREKDIAMYDNALHDIDNSIDAKNKEIDETKLKIADYEKKESIFDEYNNVYYELFGETLDRYYITNKEKFEPVKENALGKDEVVINENNGTKGNKENRNVVNGKTENIQVASDGQGKVNSENNYVEAEPEKKEENKAVEKEDTKLVITSKTMFNDIYKKISKGTITDKEIDALTEVLSDKDNYDKYGITTGIVFNKAKKILKYQGKNSFKKIEKFLRESNSFSEDIKFNTNIENGTDICSHEILNDWDKMNNELVSSNSLLSVEKYIEQIEKYKTEGNELSEKQNAIYNKAMEIKKTLSISKKALNTNNKVMEERISKNNNSILHSVLKNKMQTKTLPEARTENESRNRGVVVMDRPFGLNMENMIFAPGENSSELSNRETDSVNNRKMENQEKTK